MSSNKTRNSLARQWELLKILPARSEGKSAAQIKNELSEAGYSISKRQVERDLLDLQEFFGLECNDDRMPYKWRWSFEKPLDFPAITLAEALSLVVVEETLKPLLPISIQKALQPKFLQAHSQLVTMGKKSPTARWAKKVKTVPMALPLLPPVINEQVLEEIQTSLLLDEQISAIYQGNSEKVLELHLHPLGLVTQGSVVYLVATANDYSDIRLYALHRFKKASRTFVKSKLPKGFSLDRYIEEGALQFGEGAEIDLVASISDDLVRILMETPIAANQVIESKSDRWQIKATLFDTWQLRWWILSRGSDIKVLKPSALAKEIYSILKNGAKQYE